MAAEKRELLLQVGFSGDEERDALIQEANTGMPTRNKELCYQQIPPAMDVTGMAQFLHQSLAAEMNLLNLSMQELHAISVHTDKRVMLTGHLGI